MENFFCNTTTRCPTLYIISNNILTDLSIPNYKDSFKSDELINQIIIFLKSKQGKYWICVKGSGLISINSTDDNNQILKSLKEKKSSNQKELVDMIFDDFKSSQEYLTENVLNKLKELNEKEYKFLYKVKLVGSSSGPGGSIRQLILKKTNLYVKNNKISSLICTFNQGEASQSDKKELEDNILKLLSKMYGSNNNYPDLIIFGLQESSYDFIISSLTSINYHRIGYGNLTQNIIGTIGLGYMYLHVFVKNTNPEDNTQIVTIESLDVTTGDCDNKLEKKGKIAIPIKITHNGKNEIINFVNVHLPSNPSKINERNNCLKKSTDNLKDNSIFVFGDMNYRTNNIHKVPENEKDVIQKKSEVCCNMSETKASSSESTQVTPENNPGKKYIDELLQKDQLISQSVGFKEALITFCPTCRYKEEKEKEEKLEANRCNYDTKRYPSWCDRILYFLEPKQFGIVINEKSYTSKNITYKSDHALVLLEFSVSLEQKGGYYDKYLKYKQKYLNFKKMLGGDPNCDSLGTKGKILTGYGLADVIKSGCKIGDFVQGNDKDNVKLMNKFLEMFREKKITTTQFLKVYNSDDLRRIKDKYTSQDDPFQLDEEDLKNDEFFTKITFDDLIKLYNLTYVYVIYLKRNKDQFRKETFFEHLIWYNLKNKKITLSTLLKTIINLQKILIKQDIPSVFDEVFADVFFSPNKEYEIFNSFWDEPSVTHELFYLLFKDYLKNDLHTNFCQFLLKKLLSEKINTDIITTKFITPQSTHFNLKDPKILDAFKIIYNTVDILKLKRELFVWAENKIKTKRYPIFNKIQLASSEDNFLILIYEGFGIEDFMKQVTTNNNQSDFDEYVKLKKLIPNIYSSVYLPYIYKTVPTVKIYVDSGFILNKSFIEIAKQRKLEYSLKLDNEEVIMNVLKFGSNALDW
jgi:hypothetical protein